MIESKLTKFENWKLFEDQVIKKIKKLFEL